MAEVIDDVTTLASTDNGKWEWHIGGSEKVSQHSYCIKHSSSNNSGAGRAASMWQLQTPAACYFEMGRPRVVPPPPVSYLKHRPCIAGLLVNHLYGMALLSP